MARANEALRGTIRLSDGSSPVSASGPARGAPGRHGYRRIGTPE